MQIKRVSITVFSVLFSLLLPSFVYAQRNQPEVVSIPDPNLAAAIRQEIGNSITTHTLLNLTRLEVSRREIKDLTGLQHARNLKELILYTSDISDISPLAELKKLTVLVLRSKSILDLSPFSELTQLTVLNLVGNILDISPLAALTQLTGLGLRRNNISDISPLAGLKKLTWLSLENNNISDISALAGLKKLTWLALDWNNISDISALAELKELTSLDLWNNSISDISALAELKQLKKLNLASNNLSDISALAELKELTELGLFSNNLSDISALSALKQLTWLDIPLNNISDISPLATLKQLTWLRLSNNNISDVSPLAGLKKLTWLELGDNSISDVSPIVRLNLTGTERDSTGLYIERNPLSYVSINTHIPAMQARGIEVKFDPRVPTTLVKISGIAQQSGINSAVPFPFVVEVRDQENLAFAGVPVKFAVIAGGGKLIATTVTTDARGRASAQLRMGPTLGTTTVRVTAAHILKSVQFTATALPHSTPVSVPDANLRARITETLRKPPDATLTAADMLKLRALIANDADIQDLTGLQHASNLTILSLNNNRISDVSPLVGLTQLTTLALRDNWISNVSPLVDLAQLRASTNLQMLYLQGNPLSDIAVGTHIPWLQAAGVDVRFDNDLTQSEYVVRLIYFRPRDRQPPPNINAKMDQLIKDVQQFYADQMEAYGFGRKTFQFETDAHGNAIVYHIVGRFKDTDYADYSNNPYSEIGEQLRGSKRIQLFVLDRNFRSRRVCGTGSGSSQSGSANIYGLDCLKFRTVAHELGHAFGLWHDFRSGSYIMSYGSDRWKLSQCAAEWLDVHRYFNTHRATVNAKTIIEMLPPSLASPPNAIHLRFKVTDPDGLHQVQLLTETLSGSAKGSQELIACKHLNGKIGDTVDFTTTSLGPENRSVSLHVMDVNGNFPYSRTIFPVDVTSLLPPPRVVPIPDPNLAEAIRQEVGNSITTHTLLHLTKLNVSNREIKNLTGLEHAPNLNALSLSSSAILDFSPIVGLTGLTRLHLDIAGHNISDVSPLAELKNLTGLWLWDNNISDVSPLANLTNLRDLRLTGNNISDVAPLASLKNLNYLDLTHNNISDISPLVNLKKLTHLHLAGNNISDVAPLADLTNLRDLRLTGDSNNISDISPLANLKNLTHLYLGGNNISDVSPLTDLTNLIELGLGSNNISDVSPLASLTKLTELWLTSNNISDVSPLITLYPEATSRGLSLFLSSNPLSDTSINTHIPALQVKGIRVRFDNRVSPGDFADTLEKITGPWLWMIAPTDRYQGGAPSIDVDSLAAVSRGIVTEAEVATNGANEGDRVGNFVWTPGDISPTEGDINECLNRIGMTTGDVDDHSAYALFSLPSDAERTGVRMLVGSDDAIKVWLNGEVVHKNAVNRPASDFQDTFQVDLKKGENLLLVKVSERSGAWRMFVGIGRDGGSDDTQNSDITADVNGDGVVNIQDLVLVSSRLEEAGENAADVNGDGVVNIQDLVLVAGELGGAAAAPSAWHATSAELPSRARVEQWLAAAYRVPHTDAQLRRGIDWLERLLAALPPKETALLTNYPNPFNPETWIPYQLSEPAAVTIRIYAVKGNLVRTLVLGHQPAGMYHRKNRAAYWDGRNAQGEKVASGLYFYTLTAADFTATRKMLIRK
ncbi:hypothetical protein C6500_17085 [Candidatus Poribacteria bacterium]|nr:MAG: hypothetical protein C6500_17085 [Candidatus Poribacteria bacterium]